MAHSLPYLANCSTLFTELPLLERPAAARAAGFDAVEFWWPFATAVPADRDVERFVAAVLDAGVWLVAMNLFGGDLSDGQRGLMSWPGRSSELSENLDVAMDLGERLGVTAFNALYGNRIPGVPARQQDELAVANLVSAASAAARIGARVLVEPLSAVPLYPLRTAEDVIAVLDLVEQVTGPNNVRLLADLYHLTVNGDDLAQVVARFSARIGHIQIADSPGRHEPGTGTIEFDDRLSRLQSLGYDGWVGVEYLPTSTTEAGLDQWLPRDRRRSTCPRTRPGH